MSKSEADKLTKNGIEVLIPSSVALNRYGIAAAENIKQLRTSQATIAKEKAPNEFRWYLTYIQPENPDTNDPAEFAKALIDGTKLYLVAKGFQWKGATELHGELPLQIRSRYEEHAKLMCSGERKIDDVDIADVAAGTVDHTRIDNIIAAVKRVRETYSGKGDLIDVVLFSLEKIKN